MIAYAGLAGLPPQAGLYTLLATLAAYAIFGTSRHVVGGRDVGGGRSPRLDRRRPRRRATSPTTSRTPAALVLFCGVIFLLAGVLPARVHRAVPLAAGDRRRSSSGSRSSSPSTSFPKLFGIESGEGDTIRQLAHVIAHLGDTSGATLAVGAAALVLLFAGERFVAARAGRARRARARDRRQRGARPLASTASTIVGKVPSGLPSVGLPDVAARRHLGRSHRRRGRDAARDLQRVARRRRRTSRPSTATRSTRTRS